MIVTFSPRVGELGRRGALALTGHRRAPSPWRAAGDEQGHLRALVDLAGPGGRRCVWRCPWSTVSQVSCLSLTLKPASLSVRLASACGRLVTSGTVAWPGPSDTTRVTVEPLSTLVPGCGSWRSTLVDLARAETTRWRSTWKPAFLRTPSPVASWRPDDVGHRHLRRPREEEGQRAAGEQQRDQTGGDPRPPAAARPALLSRAARSGAPSGALARPAAAADAAAPVGRRGR